MFSYVNSSLLFFILALMINNTFDEREAESEGTELALLDDILTSTAKVQTDVILLLSLGFIAHFNMTKPAKQNHYSIK